MNIREQQLLQLGFEKIEHQQTFCLYKYDATWYVDFWKISDYTDHKWGIFIDDIKYDLETVKKQYYEDLKQHPAYDFAQKEIKQKLLNKLNHYKSNLQEETKVKLNRLANKEKIRELEIRIETLKELMNGK
jgi:hypothetical protein